MWLMLGLGAVGFLDDFIKIRKQRSLGLSARAKFIGQLFVGLSFAILALMFKNGRGLAPASVHLSFVRDIPQISFGVVGFVIVAYVVISGYEFRNSCSAAGVVVKAGCYQVRDPLDLALVAAAAMAACFGFLWWNASPARIGRASCRERV